MKTVNRNLWQEAVDCMCAISINRRHLITEEFHAAWMEWIECLRKRGALPKKEDDVILGHIRKCWHVNEVDAVAAIRRAIAGNRDDLDLVLRGNRTSFP